MEAKKRNAAWNRYDWIVERAGNNKNDLFPNCTFVGKKCERDCECEIKTFCYCCWYHSAAHKLQTAEFLQIGISTHQEKLHFCIETKLIHNQCGKDLHLTEKR